MRNFELESTILGNENLSVRLQNTIYRIVLKDCTLEYLVLFKEVLLNRIVGMRTRAEFLKLTEEIEKELLTISQ